MKFLTMPSKLGVFQLLAACLLVSLLCAPGNAMGPMLIIKGGHGHGSGAGSILAVGLLIKLLSHLKHHHHKGGYDHYPVPEHHGGYPMPEVHHGGYPMPEGHHGGYPMPEGHHGGYPMPEAHHGGYPMPSGRGYDIIMPENIMGHSMKSHEEDPENLSYDQQEYAFAK